MVTFHAKGKVELTVLTNKFEISHVIDKCLHCAMFEFHQEIFPISKDDAYNANNSVMRSIY
jgi:hypothetical protein